MVNRSATGTELEMTVRARDQLADGVVALTLQRLDGSPVPPWAPGAHVDLVLTPELVRQYTLCGDPAERSTVRVAVLRERDGRGGSRHVHERLRAGDQVRVRGPRNHFPLLDAAKYLFVAGGIGITPILPMIYSVARRDAGWRLVYGGRSRSSMAFADELRQRFGDRVSICPQDEVGLLELAEALDSVGEAATVYCCGPEPLIAAVERECRLRPGLALRVERFAAVDPVGPGDSGEPDGPGGEFRVELARSARTVTVPVGVSIVDALADAGVEVETSCREGICGTCETAVQGGVPDHRDSVLSTEEKAANDTMMLCVSRCRSGQLVLDL